ncbi:prepilin-type N-terminal cleavage/methylation domain-containing protein [Demequina sp. NBRC 110054]|uniref:prepilin-type N-terminal cleavage/methylation domain-containing protein n=1 Tax=Demequina sp. NBRC 110054 TaxID=1570343 RepID=UPI000A05C8AC|nr:prepilin-type N-terminal cleavage/methylation domain-containing protein [Demequina sp. NBRC 110054]
MPRTWKRRPDDAGLTLTELLISMAIFGVLMAIVFTALISVTYMSKDTLGQVRAIEEARLGVSQIDRQIRSGNVILDPASESVATSGVGAFFSMRINTQEDGDDMCVQWRVIDSDGDGFGDLQFRKWEPGNTGSVTDWGVVARNLVEMDVSPTSEADIDPDDPTTWPPFWVDTTNTSTTTAQFVRVTLRLKDPDARDSAKAVSVSTVVTGRNSVIGYPESKCQAYPAP